MPPYESSHPLVLASIALAAISIFAWLKTQARPWLAIAILAACTALAAFVADRMVATGLCRACRWPWAMGRPRAGAAVGVAGQ